MVSMTVKDLNNFAASVVQLSEAGVPGVPDIDQRGAFVALNGKISDATKALMIPGLDLGDAICEIIFSLSLFMQEHSLQFVEVPEEEIDINYQAEKGNVVLMFYFLHLYMVEAAQHGLDHKDGKVVSPEAIAHQISRAMFTIFSWLSTTELSPAIVCRNMIDNMTNAYQARHSQQPAAKLSRSGNRLN